MKSKSYPFKKLQTLGPEKAAAVDDMLLKGEVPRKIALFIQNEWGDFKDIKPDSLKKSLERYRATTLRERTINQIAGTTKGMLASTLRHKLNAMEELEKLMLIQKARHEKVLLIEVKAPLLLKQASDEGRLLKEMLVELGKLQLETGVLQRAPKRLSGSILNPDGTVQKFEWTEEQEQLFRELDSSIGEVTYEPID